MPCLQQSVLPVLTPRQKTILAIFAAVLALLTARCVIRCCHINAKPLNNKKKMPAPNTKTEILLSQSSTITGLSPSTQNPISKGKEKSMLEEAEYYRRVGQREKAFELTKQNYLN